MEALLGAFGYVGHKQNNCGTNLATHGVELSSFAYTLTPLLSPKVEASETPGSGTWHGHWGYHKEHSSASVTTQSGFSGGGHREREQEDRTAQCHVANASAFLALWHRCKLKAPG